MMTAEKQILSVFDLDETLVRGDSSMIWHQYLVDKGIVRTVGFLDEDQRLMDLYAQGKLDMQGYLDFSLAAIADLETSDVEALVSDFASSYVVPKVFPAAQQLLSQLRQRGDKLLVISASASFLIEPVVQLLGIEDVLGIDLHEVNGRYTSKVVGTMSFREGKVTRLKQWLEGQTARYSEIHFYSDSINDLPLLEYADQSSVVNPGEVLLGIAQLNQWPVFDWKLTN